METMVTTRQSTVYAVHGYDLTQGLRSSNVQISNMHHFSSMQSPKCLFASASAHTAVTVIQCSREHDPNAAITMSLSAESILAAIDADTHLPHAALAKAIMSD